MKQYLLFLIPFLFLVGASTAYACTTDADCPGSAPGSCNVTTGICSTPNNPGGTQSLQQAATQALESAQQSVSSPAATQVTTAGSNLGTAVASQTNVPQGSFVPLTKLPGVAGNPGSIYNSNINFIGFFNNLYRICIGFAAAIALLQIIRAGIMWMAAGDNGEQISHARSLIVNSVFGLVLVLSPVIVFSAINPNILSLQLNVANLVVNQTSASTPGSTPVSACPTGAAAITANSVIGGSVPQSCCLAPNHVSVMGNGATQYCLAPGQTTPNGGTGPVCSAVTVGTTMQAGLANTCCPTGNVVTVGNGATRWCLAAGQTTPPGNRVEPTNELVTYCATYCTQHGSTSGTSNGRGGCSCS